MSRISVQIKLHFSKCRSCSTKPSSCSMWRRKRRWKLWDCSSRKRISSAGDYALMYHQQTGIRSQQMLSSKFYKTVLRTWKLKLVKGNEYCLNSEFNYLKLLSFSLGNHNMSSSGTPSETPCSSSRCRRVLHSNLISFSKIPRLSVFLIKTWPSWW